MWFTYFTDINIVGKDSEDSFLKYLYWVFNKDDTNLKFLL